MTKIIDAFIRALPRTHESARRALSFYLVEFHFRIKYIRPSLCEIKHLMQTRFFIITFWNPYYRFMSRQYRNFFFPFDVLTTYEDTVITLFTFSQ